MDRTISDPRDRGCGGGDVELRDVVGRLSALLGVRANETDVVGRLFLAATMVGFALVFFFSGSNALFIDRVGSEQLPWVYLANAPLVIVFGLGYGVVARRSPPARLLTLASGLLAGTVALLWIWNVSSDGQAPAFMAAVFYRFLFIFGLLGLWEATSAAFDVRQSKRLVPVVALGVMLAFMIGGALMGVVTTIIDPPHLLAVSGVFFVLYTLAFGRVVGRVNFDDSSTTIPATPATILADPLARALAGMRSLTILMVFIGEFIFYQQVQANLDSDRDIAVFLGVFLAVATLTMVIVTAAFTGRYLMRFGVGVGLATMPVGLLLGAVAMIGWGSIIGDGAGLFGLAIAVNLLSMVLGQAIETPAGAVVYQPMPAERRIPIRVAVDGWLGSVALLLVGLLLLVARMVGIDDTVPVAILLGLVALAATLLSRRLHRRYQQSLEQATTLAFHGRRPTTTLQGMDVTVGEQANLVDDDPQAAIALAQLGVDLPPVVAALPDLANHPDDDIARLAIESLADHPDDRTPDRLAAIVADPNRSDEVRATALRTLHRRTPGRAHAQAERVVDALRGGRGAFVVAVTALLAAAGDDEAERRLTEGATSPDPEQRTHAASVLAAWPAGTEWTPAAESAFHALAVDSDPDVARIAIDAPAGPLSERTTHLLLHVGEHRRHRRSAVAALGRGGSTTVEIVDPLIGDLDDDYVADLVDVVYARNTRRPRLLHPFLDPTNSSTLRRAGFDAVRHADIELPATVDRMMRDDVAWAQLVLAARDATDPTPGGPLDLALTEEFETTRQTLWAALRAKGAADRVSELEAVATRAGNDDRANAIEALDSLLPRATRDIVVPILEPATMADAQAAADATESRDGTATLTTLRDEPRTGPATARLINHHLHPDQDPNMSSMLERVVALKGVDIFSTLPYSLLTELAELVEERTVEPGETLVAKGDQGHELFALVEGDVNLDGSETTFTAGTAFGELAVLDPGPRSATLVAATTATVLVVTRDVLLALTDRHPAVMAEIARVLAARLRATAD